MHAESFWYSTERSDMNVPSWISVALGLEDIVEKSLAEHKRAALSSRMKAETIGKRFH